MLTAPVCEACQNRMVEVVETMDDPNQPYRLCTICHHRLHTRALRPIEWYNLASIHTPTKPLLHDDFYDEDGLACQPEDDFVATECELAPTLKHIQHELTPLLNFAVTRWYLEAEVIQAFKQHDALETLHAVKMRFQETNNVEVKSRMLEIAADVIGTEASDWIRALWYTYDEPLLYPLAAATSSSLPPDEGLALVYHQLSTVSRNELPNAAFFCLYRFRSPDVLDWIESHCEQFDDHWGSLAAVSLPTWSRMKAWLQLGRPLSLVALDTMVNCVEGYGGIYVAESSPRILEPVPSEIESVLLQYQQNDPVPRVQTNVSIILQNRNDLFYL
ncbi:hypothetical protein [Exiguobacterium sp. SL-9]|uniref:hypothetical protein n=1 Tax=Exiguobacterium sp. SL-9 TaxID=2510963 RepID=UPI00103DE5AC|nr:hypothetical protein [Exiguobacterium sp. SL-9]TCI23004.1 hypothetical protein EVJ34_00900 [Exiguobacterium sp. SL-9]